MDSSDTFSEAVTEALSDWEHCWAIETIETFPHRAVFGIRVEYLDRPIRFSELESRCLAAGLSVRVTALESVDDPEIPRLRVDVRWRVVPEVITGP